MKTIKDRVSTIHDDLLPDGWTKATIQELIDSEGIFIDGDWVESKDQDPDGDVRLIQLADVGDCDYRNRSSRFLTKSKALELKCTFLQEGDVLVARMPDPLGRACLFPGDEKESVTVVDVSIIRVNPEKADHRWLMYILNSLNVRNAIQSLQSGTTRQRISRSNLATIEIPLPPLDQQKHIVAAIEQQFTRLDAGVAALKSAREKLRRYRAAVLKAAVEGKLTEQWRAEHPDVEPASKLLERLLAERRQKWEEEQRAKGKDPSRMKYQEPAVPDTAGLPELPDGWVWTTVEQLSTKVVDGTHHTPTYLQDGIPFISVKDIYDGKIDFSECKYISNEEHLHLIQRCKPELDDILITKSGTIGRVAIVKTKGEFSLFVSVALIKTLKESLSQEYLRLALEYYIQTINIQQDIKGGLIKNLHLEDLRIVPLVLPPLNEQFEIVNKVEEQLSFIKELMKAIEINLQHSEKLRQAILQKAFIGKLLNKEDNLELAASQAHAFSTSSLARF